MSPLCTQLLHEVTNSQHLGAIRLICFEMGDLFGEGATISEPARSLHEGRSDRVRATHAGRLEGTERSESFLIQANRDGS
jgi:hypothetical protein